MTTKSEYICNLCGAKTSTDEIINNTQKELIYGLYFINGKERKYEIRNPWECNIHICDKCVKSIMTLFNITDHNI